jgi:hypothetical protein
MYEKNSGIPQEVLEEFPELARMNEIYTEELERMFELRGGSKNVTLEDMLQARKSASDRLKAEMQEGKND